MEWKRDERAIRATAFKLGVLLIMLALLIVGACS